jgi:predicted phosphodiesterase
MATTFLILSDAHDDAFPDLALLPRKVDVVLHCGDLTMIGRLSNYEKAIANTKAIDAELKLVTAGNHACTQGSHPDVEGLYQIAL